MNDSIILVVNGRQAAAASLVNWPDANSADPYETVLKCVHSIDLDRLEVRIDGETGPVFDATTLPRGVGFYQKIKHPVRKTATRRGDHLA